MWIQWETRDWVRGRCDIQAGLHGGGGHRECEKLQDTIEVEGPEGFRYRLAEALLQSQFKELDNCSWNPRPDC